jgi:hypothetical protein
MQHDTFRWGIAIAVVLIVSSLGLVIHGYWIES